MKKYAITNVQPPWSRYEQGWRIKVYDCIARAGETGANRREIATELNLNVGRVSSYLAELKRLGLVKRLGDAIDQNSLTPEESTLYALQALENALVSNATHKGVTSEMEIAFARYQKIKSRALGSTFQGEAKTALRMAVIDIVKLVL